jgi:hypothetical protein
MPDLGQPSVHAEENATEMPASKGVYTLASGATSVPAWVQSVVEHSRSGRSSVRLLPVSCRSDCSVVPCLWIEVCRSLVSALSIYRTPARITFSVRFPA